MFLLCKLKNYKRHHNQRDENKKTATEKELNNLNHKIVSDYQH